MPGENAIDPRARLVREKYFSLRPKPLERWLWAQGVPPAAERVFWLHWQEGQQRGDWCSEVSLRQVARECCVDSSTVTKAYQLLTRLGCLRRTDPGRDPANPFQQAIAVTEVRIPRELLIELDRHPNRRAQRAPESEICVQRTPSQTVSKSAPEAPRSPDPFAGLSGRERIRAMTQLEQSMSAGELARYRQAHRFRLAQVSFDEDSKLSAEERGRVLQLLSILSAAPARTPAQTSPSHTASPQRQQLSVFELARLKRDIQAAVNAREAPELLRQVVWSIEAGSLKRFSPTHAIHIALKKLREGAWTRPHRMPPNWARSISTPAALETCRYA